MDVLLSSIDTLLHSLACYCLLACRACCASLLCAIYKSLAVCVVKLAHCVTKCIYQSREYQWQQENDGEMTCSRGRTHFVTVRIPFGYVHRYEIHIYGSNKRNFYCLLVSLSPMNIAGIIPDLWWWCRGVTVVSVRFVVSKWDLLAEMFARNDSICFDSIDILLNGLPVECAIYLSFTWHK